jgi:hypothetical protein
VRRSFHTQNPHREPGAPRRERRTIPQIPQCGRCQSPSPCSNPNLHCLAWLSPAVCPWLPLSPIRQSARAARASPSGSELTCSFEARGTLPPSDSHFPHPAHASPIRCTLPPSGSHFPHPAHSATSDFEGSVSYETKPVNVHRLGASLSLFEGVKSEVSEE